MNHNQDELLKSLMDSEQKDARKKAIRDVIEYGRYLNRIRQEKPEVISGEDIVNHLIKHGLPVYTGIQMLYAIQNPQTEYSIQ